jgi:D-glycero-D-manno-heptose 1,7-bisphosphate phosphatase
LAMTCSTPTTEGSRAVFVDKDGTLIVNVPYNVNPRWIQFAPGALAGLRRLHCAGYSIVVVTNQAGVAHGYFDEQALAVVEATLRRRLADNGIPLAGFYYCPHHPQAALAEYREDCDCRKPSDGMLRRAARELDLVLADSWMIGDILDDVEAGHRAGCRSILLQVGSESEWYLDELRSADLEVRDLDECASAILMADAQRGVA